MSIVLFLQNLTQIFWSIIFGLNLYVVVVLYRVSKVYRSERYSKLEATAYLRREVDCMRNQFIESSQSEIMTVNHKPAVVSTAVDNKPMAAARGDMPLIAISKKVRTHSPLRSKSMEAGGKKITKTIKSFTNVRNASSSSSMLSNRSDEHRHRHHHPHTHPHHLQNHRSNKLALVEQQHTLYISDSYGRVVQEIPFNEKDYMEALCTVLNT